MRAPRVLVMSLLACALVASTTAATPTARPLPSPDRVVTTLAPLAGPRAQPVVVATFAGPASGSVALRPDGAGQSVVAADLSGLVAGAPYFVTAQENARCDPSTLAVAGPVVADRAGRVRLVTTIATGDARAAATTSVSVRQGDAYNDADGDGIRGPIDVVAVVGSPQVGLVACSNAITLG